MDIKLMGTQEMSYTVELNYSQCPHRVWLMSQEHSGGVRLYPPMVRGLVLHLVYQSALRGEPLRSVEEMLMECRTSERGDWGLRDIIFYPPYEEASFIKNLSEEAKLVYAQSLKWVEWFNGVYGDEPFHTELKCHRRYFDTVMSGHLDACKRYDGGWIGVDLKTGSFDPNSEQFLLYNFILNGFVGRRPFVIVHWTGETLESQTVYHTLLPEDPKLGYLLAKMRYTQYRITQAEEAIKEGLHPAKALIPYTRQFTCHPYRCSCWELCKYGKRKMTQEAENGTERPRG